MKLKLLGYPVSAINAGGVLMIDFRLFFSVAFDFVTLNSVAQELRSVSECNYKRIASGRNAKTYISGDGVIEYLSCTTRISINQKNHLVKLLSDIGIKSSYQVSNSRKENNFYDSLSEYLSVYGVDVKRQVSSGYGHVFDMVIFDKFIIEYDENSHVSYSKESENKREEWIASNGYTLIRLSDKNSDIKNIALLADVLNNNDQSAGLAIAKLKS